MIKIRIEIKIRIKIRIKTVSIMGPGHENPGITSTSPGS